MSSPLEIDQLIVPLIDGYTILDVGCGWGKWGSLIRTCWYRTTRGKGDTIPRLLIGADLFRPSLKRVKSHKIYDDVVLCHAAFLPFREDIVDVVLAIEMLEHIAKTEGTKVLNELEQVSKETVIVSTPHLSPYREGTMSPEGFNPYDAHISKWSVKDFKAKDYSVIGSGFCINGQSIPIMKVLLAPLSFFFPIFGCYLIAVKKRSKKQSLGQLLKKLYPM
ncbi:MAG: class I SAM-dependent methyltransferase [Candidatus Bathyarchaeia archaeon]